MANAIPAGQKEVKPAPVKPAEIPSDLPKDFEVPKNARNVVVVPGNNGAAPSVRVDF